MVNQYPHTITVNVSLPATQNANGNWVSGGTNSFTLNCRLEPNGAGRLLQLTDGKQIVYAAIVYMPVGEERIPELSMVTVTDFEGNTIGTGKTLLFSKGQLNRRLWL